MANRPELLIKEKPTVAQILAIGLGLTKIAQKQGGANLDRADGTASFNIVNPSLTVEPQYPGVTTRSILGEIFISSDIYEEGSMDVLDKIQGKHDLVGDYEFTEKYEFMWEEGQVKWAAKEIDGDTGVILYKGLQYQPARSDLDLLMTDMQNASDEMSHFTKRDCDLLVSDVIALTDDYLNDLL